MSKERILWFDEQLRAGRYPGSAELAARFKISIRTAQRDIEALRDRLHAPLKRLAAKKGYAYDDSFDLPSAFFRKEELIALLFSRSLFRAIRTPLAEEAKALSARLEEMFRAPLPAKLEAAVSVDIGEGNEIQGKIFFDLLRAIIGRKVARLRFARREEAGSGGSVTEVEPVGLQCSRGGWLLLAYPGKKKEGIRSFHVSRLRRVDVTGQSFTPRRGKIPSAEEIVRRRGAIFRGGKARDVRIRFSPSKAEWASMHAKHHDGRIQFELDGSAVLELPEAPVPRVLGLVLQLPGDARIIAPEELRDAMQSEIDRLASLFPERKR